ANPELGHAGTGSGVLTSGNGGLSWSDASNGALDGVSVTCTAIDPTTPSGVLIGTRGGVLESTDGGASWSSRLKSALAIYNVVFGSQHTVYAADFDDVTYYAPLAPSTLYTSTDKGRTWISVPTSFTIVPGTLVADPSQPSTLYTGNGSQVLRSIDGGLTW